MNEDRKFLPATSIWHKLIYGGTAIGVLLGLLEVCCVYFLPTFFPRRRYELPISTIGRFLLIAIVIDVLLALVGVTFLGVLISVVRKVWQRAHSFHHWPALVCFSLIAGALSYLYVGFVYTYSCFNTDLRPQAVMIGISSIILISIVVVWLLGMVLQRFGKDGLTVVWILAFVVLLCAITPNYLLYRSANTVEMNLPSLSINQLPNVLLVTLDTLRADHLGCYGNKIVQTPVLDALAADGFLFEAAFAQSPLTTPSHCSIMTSTYVAHHGAMNGSAMRVGLPTIAEILLANGYETVAFVSSTMVRSGNSGLHRGFDYYEDSLSPYTPLLRNDEFHFVLLAHFLTCRWVQNNEIPGYIVSDRSLAWLDRSKKGPFFCWLHYFDPHHPYDAPKPYKDMYDGKIDANLPVALDRSRYAGEVTYTDAQLGRFIRVIKRKGLYDDMLIIVTADHGEAFGEKHGDITEYRHGQHLYDTTQHVPLIIKLPGRKATAHRIQDVVQLLDLAPTLLDWLGASPPDSFVGRSLLDLINGEQRSEPGSAYAEKVDLAGISQTDSQIHKKRRLMAMRTPDIKYICNTTLERQELYDIASDRAETINVYLDKPELAKSCYQSIWETLGEPFETGVTDFDSRVLEQLRSLGYIE